jgi:SAM-dependent methyltransferase
MYDEFYRQGRDFARFPIAERAFVRALVRRHRLKPGLRVLDVGCGTGKYAGLFARFGAQVVGVDLSREAVGRARGRFRGVPFMVGDVLALGLLPDWFDVVFCSGLPMFNEPELDRLRPLMHRLVQFLKRGGLFVFVKTTSLTDRPSKGNTRFDHSLSAFELFFRNVSGLELVESSAGFPQGFVLLGPGGFSSSITRLSMLVAKRLRLPVRVNVVLRRS